MISFRVRKRRRIFGAAKVFLTLVLVATSFFSGHESRSAILRSFTDTVSDSKINNGSNHQIKFQSLTGVDSSGDAIVVSFDTGFNLLGLDFGDVDFSHGPISGSETEETLAAAAAAGTWGATFSGQALTLIAPTDAGGSEIAANDFVVIEIGTNASTGQAGNTQITNPSSVGSYRIFVGGSFGDEGRIAVPVLTDNQVAVSATVTTGQPIVTPPPPPPPPPPGGGGDTTPPVISNIAVTNITQTSASVTWTTNEPATSFVDYGTTIAYGGTSGDGTTLVTGHTVILNSLQSGTLYHFRVRSADSSGNQATSSDGNFTTLAGGDITPPIISDVAVSNITGSEATVTWTTNEPATSRVEYGTTVGYGSNLSDATLAISHSITLIGLNSETLYHFRVLSEDESANEAASPDGTFTTLDATPPIISDVSVINITETTARVTWTTDEPATSLVQYGTSETYGSEGSGPGLATSHSVLLIGLTADTLYHFRVVSGDAVGNSSAFPDQTFVTSPDITPPPNISNFRVIAVSEHTITLAWNPPVSPDYQGIRIQMQKGNFPTSPSEGSTVYEGQGSSVTVSGLDPGTTYFFTGFAFDAVRNYSSGALADGTTLSPPSQPPVEPPVIPPEVPPEVPPVEVPPVTVPEGEKITIDDLHLLVSGRTLELPIINGVARVLTNLAVTASIGVDAFSKETLMVILNVGGSSYLLEKNLAGTAFETGFILPSYAGDLKSDLIVDYADGSKDAIGFNFQVENLGRVYEVRGGAQIPVSGAEVALYAHDGTTIVWDAAPYNQTNPIIVGNDGSFYFLVPSGDFHLEVKKEGYRKGESPVFAVGDTIVNKEIEILRIPPKLQDVIKPEASLSENVTAVAKNIEEQIVYTKDIVQEEVKKVIDNVNVENTNRQFAAPAIATVAVANVAAAVSIFEIAAYLQFLFTQPFLLLERRRRKGWGTVYNALSKLPIDLAIVRLLDAQTGRTVVARVTDKQGRYSFVVAAGRYRIEVIKKGFAFPTTFLKKEKDDVGFTDIYHGEEIKATEDNANIIPNVPLDPMEKAVTPKKIIVYRYLRKLNRLVAASGVILAIVSFIITPKLIFGLLAAAQIALYMLFRRLAKTKRPKSWGMVYDETSRKPLRFAVARIFETTYNKLLETQVADSRGRYAFLVGRNKYYVTYEKLGYEKKQTGEIDLTTSEKPEVVAQDVGLKKL